MVCMTSSEASTLDESSATCASPTCSYLLSSVTYTSTVSRTWSLSDGFFDLTIGPMYISPVELMASEQTAMPRRRHAKPFT